MQAQAKAPSSVAIPFGEDLEHLKFPDDMFTDDPLAGECTIVLLVFFAQLLSSAFLLWGAAIGMQFLYSLIAPIPQTLCRGDDPDLAALEEREVMLSSLPDGYTNDLTTLVSDDQLRFLSVTFLLATVVATLFF